MLTAVGLFLSIAGAPATTAVWTRDDEWRPVLKVTSGGKSCAVREPKPATGHGAGWSFMKAKFYGMPFHGLSFTGGNTQIVNAKTRDVVDLPQPPGTPSVELVPECEGGIPLKTCMLWLYVWSNRDQMGEPVGAVYGFLVGEKGGKPVLLRSIDLGGLAGGHYGVGGARLDDTLMLEADSWPQPGIALINLDTFSFTISHAGGIVMSDSGRAFRQDGNKLTTWDWVSRSWKLLRREPDRLVAAFGVGNDDLLKCTRSISLARKGSVYRVPRGENGLRSEFQLFLDRDTGVGLVWRPNPAKPQVKGAFLRLKDLSRLCAITEDPKYLEAWPP